jgi:hypothetical protein
VAVLCRAEVGWEYERVGELSLVEGANLRWLAGYRHPRCARASRVLIAREGRRARAARPTPEIVRVRLSAQAPNC